MIPLFANDQHRAQYEKLDVKRICARAWMDRQRIVESKRDVPRLISDGVLFSLFRKRA